MKSKKSISLKTAIDYILWAIIWLLPFISFVVSFWRQEGAVPIFEYIDANFAFSYVKDILDRIWDAAFGSSPVISGYISYLVMVEVVHVMFDAVVFIPRFAHDLIERCSGFLGG